MHWKYFCQFQPRFFSLSFGCRSIWPSEQARHEGYSWCVYVSWGYTWCMALIACGLLKKPYLLSQGTWKRKWISIVWCGMNCFLQITFLFLCLSFSLFKGTWGGIPFSKWIRMYRFYFTFFFTVGKMAS